MRESNVTMRRTITAVAIGALVGLGAGNAAAKSLNVNQSLSSTGIDANAKGSAKLNLKASGARGKFDVKANHLDGDQSFDVIVNGVKVGTLQTSRGGSGHASFSTNPSKHDSALGFDPRGTTVDVRDDNGNDVLVGDIPDDSVDPNAVACCVADNGGDGEVECEDLTADACTAAGGTAAVDAAGAPVASCLPDPCGGTSPVPESEIVCCTNQTGDDESESECEDESAAECAAAGGMVVQATSCDPNPCAPTPPSAETACCITKTADDGTQTEVECEVTTPESCTAQNGTAVDGGTCSTDPCGTGATGGDTSGDDSSGGGN